jgi:hypothetical protein
MRLGKVIADLSSQLVNLSVPIIGRRVTRRRLKDATGSSQYCARPLGSESNRAELPVHWVRTIYRSCGERDTPG